MSPRYEPNTSDVSSTLEVFPKDSYEFKITNIKPSFKVKEKDGQQTDNVAMTVTLEHTGGLFAGKKFVQIFNHVEPGGSGEPFLKTLLMAAYGYAANKQAENAYNRDLLPTKDQSFDTDTGEVGSLYQGAIGNVLMGDVTEYTYEGQNRNRCSFRPLHPVAV